jgi:preprotein translocase subunit SecG
MFIVRKNRHEPNYVGTTYDVMRVADSGSIIEYFKEKGVSIVPSKVVWIVMHLFLFLFLLLSYLIC